MFKVCYIYDISMLQIGSMLHKLFVINKPSNMSQYCVYPFFKPVVDKSLVSLL